MDMSAHRVIYNGDWGAMFWAPNLWQPEGGPYSARAMHAFAQLLADSGVDTFAISPNTQIAWYPSQVVPTALDGYSRGDARWAGWFRDRRENAITIRSVELAVREMRGCAGMD